MVKKMVFSIFLDFESIKNQLIDQFYIKNVMVQDFLSSFVFLVNDSVILPKKSIFFSKKIKITLPSKVHRKKYYDSHIH